MLTVYWLIAAVVLLVVEIITVSLTSIWFAGGAIVAAIISTFNKSLVVQLVAFIVVTAILLVLTRPMAKKFLNRKVEKTNADALIGRKCKVLETIDAEHSSNNISINGIVWGAKPADGIGRIEKGSIVVITGIAGVKLIVEPVK